MIKDVIMDNMSSSPLEGNALMDKRPYPGETIQCADIYFALRDLTQDARRQGYDPHALADALLEAALDILADNYEFMTVFDRFTKRRNIYLNEVTV
jgi:hypothetical protein